MKGGADDVAGEKRGREYPKGGSLLFLVVRGRVDNILQKGVYPLTAEIRRPFS